MNRFEILNYICGILQKHDVNYIIIGGMSVAYYGYSRITTTSSGIETDKYDIDILYQPTLTNNFNLIKCLNEFGFDQHGGGLTDFHIYRKEFNEYSLDFLPYLPFMFHSSISEKRNKFSSLYNNRNISTFDNNVNINFVSLEDLIEMKEISGRPKDIEDIKNLKGINGL